MNFESLVLHKKQYNSGQFSMLTQLMKENKMLAEVTKAPGKRLEKERQHEILQKCHRLKVTSKMKST